MKKLIVPALILLIASCSKDAEEILKKDTFTETPSEPTNDENEEEEMQDEDGQEEQSTENSSNKAPVLTLKTYLINEHSAPQTFIGFIEANDEDGDEITYSIVSDTDIIIDETTGELQVGPNLHLDYETINNLEFTIAAFDGETITEEDYNLIIEDIDETTLLTDDEEKLITYFQHLVYWKGDANTQVEHNQKWKSSMKIHLDGTISNEFSTTVDEVLQEYNTIFNDSFNIVTVENEGQANTSLFYGTEAELEGVWPDMYDIVEGGGYSGYAITPSLSSELNNSRIWISNPAAVLLKHELGHALGFGHSNKCEEENSFLCSQISTDNDFLPIEKDIIRYAYHLGVDEGQSETEIEKVLADLIVNER
ncbi:hypothetical protein [Pseudozobellia sp. WGM2]|uniref:hypothetical protein n=1 Tax=Pseudozobellia sp. WGM2 TaxID=2787625 RepID=UPI001ADEE105|nr:hypothetical protein [Pseudozobellia sp. WGM2]